MVKLTTSLLELGRDQNQPKGQQKTWKTSMGEPGSLSRHGPITGCWTGRRARNRWHTSQGTIETRVLQRSPSPGRPRPPKGVTVHMHGLTCPWLSPRRDTVGRAGLLESHGNGLQEAARPRNVSDKEQSEDRVSSESEQRGSLRRVDHVLHRRHPTTHLGDATRGRLF